MFVDRQFLRRQQLFLLWISISGWSLLSGFTGSTQASDLSLNIGIPSASTQASDLSLNICIPSASTQANDLSLNIYTVTTVAQSISLSDRFYVRRINTRERGCIMTLLCHWPLELYIPVATPRTGSPPCTYSSASLARSDSLTGGIYLILFGCLCWSTIWHRCLPLSSLLKYWND